jgi:hypothetical protein
MRHISRRARVVLAAFLLLILFAAPVEASLRTESEITYTADVDAGNLALESRLQLTNLTADVRDGDQITRFFYEEIRITVPETVQNFRASSGGQILSHTMRPGEEQDGQSFLVATIDLGRRLLYQESMELVIEYEIPGDPPAVGDHLPHQSGIHQLCRAGLGRPGSDHRQRGHPGQL